MRSTHHRDPRMAVSDALAPGAYAARCRRHQQEASRPSTRALRLRPPARKPAAGSRARTRSRWGCEVLWGWPPRKVQGGHKGDRELLRHAPLAPGA
jgi:hypothetical protein